MAIATYNTDLLDVNDAESGTWAELTGYTSGSAVVSPDTDYFIQGLGCASQATGGKTGLAVGMAYVHGTDLGIGWVAGECFFHWSVFLGGNSIDTIENGGIRLGACSDNGDCNLFYLVGSNYGRNPYGGWQNVVYDPQNTPDQVIGTPTAGVYLAFGSLLNMVSAVSKGNLHGMDVIRYGRGELIIELGELGNYATFTGIALNNDYNDITNGYNRWGLFQQIGKSFLWKGLLSLGTVTNAVDFRDSNKTFAVDDTRKTYAGFNKIEVNNASSNVEWTAITIDALGTLSKGSFEAVDNATIVKNTCVFTDMDSFIYQSNSTINTTTFRRCGLVTNGGSTMDTCTFDNASGAISVTTADLALLTDCTFNSDGSNHAVELTALGTGTMNWNNYLTAYATADGNTGNEGIYVNVATGTLTINVGAGYTIPYIRTAGAVVTVVAGQVTTTITVKNQEGDPIVGARVYAITESTIAYPTPPLTDGTLIFNTITDVNGQVSDTRSLGSPQPITGWSRDSTAPAPFYKQTPITEVIDNGTGLNLNVLLILDE